ncbi:hypothetical protein [Allocoprococcus comes]|uniref:hypothetical protein n=1 Tax=Coprococcus comes TaxID=410072 RepID=UPI0032BFEC53
MGDIITCQIDMPVRKLYANPLVRADAGCVALMRGPLVYAFEGIDNGEDLSALRIPRDASIQIRPFQPDLLGGIVPLQVSGKRKKKNGCALFRMPARGRRCPAAGNSLL